MRPPMFHLRFARSFLRFAAKAPQAAPSLRLPKRCTTHGRRRRTATNPKELRNVERGLSPPRFASPPIALRLRLRATERRQAAPEVPPAIREGVPEVRGESAAGSPTPEVAEAPHHARTSEAYRHKSQRVAKRRKGAFAPSLRFTPHRTAATPSCDRAQTGGPRGPTSEARGRT